MCNAQKEEKKRERFFRVFSLAATASYVDATAFIYIYTAFLLSVNAGLPNRAVSTLRHANQMTKPKPTTSTASQRLGIIWEPSAPYT